LETAVIVDNSVQAFACHLTNGIPVPSFFGQHWDAELSLLGEIIVELSTMQDVRPYIDSTF
jgi:hypothetical protein